MIGFREGCEKAIKEFGSRGLMYGFKKNGIVDIGHSWVFTGQAYPGDYKDNEVSNVLICKETGELKSYNKYGYDEKKEYLMGKKMDVPKEYLANVKLDESILRKLIEQLTESEDSFLSFDYKGRYCGIHRRNYTEYDIFGLNSHYIIFCDTLFLGCFEVDDVLKGRVFEGKTIIEILDDIVDFTWHRDEEDSLAIDLTVEERNIINDFSYDADIMIEDYVKYLLFAKMKKHKVIDELPDSVKEEKEDLRRTMDEEWFEV